MTIKQKEITNTTGIKYFLLKVVYIPLTIFEHIFEDFIDFIEVLRFIEEVVGP